MGKPDRGEWELGWRKIRSNAERANGSHASFIYFVNPHHPPPPSDCPSLLQRTVPKENHLRACQPASYVLTLFLKLTSDLLAALQHAWVDSSGRFQEEVINWKNGDNYAVFRPKFLSPPPPLQFPFQVHKPQGSWLHLVTRQEASMGEKAASKKLFHTHVLHAKIHLSLSSLFALGFLKQRKPGSLILLCSWDGCWCGTCLSVSGAGILAILPAVFHWWSGTCLVEHCLHPCPPLI